MLISFIINGKQAKREIAPDTILLDLLRSMGMKSVKCGCDTGNCGLCTVWLDGSPVLSCSVPAARLEGHTVTTLEGLQEEAAAFSRCLADEGADQCGFCSPGLIINVLALEREIEDPDVNQIKEYLSGNLCRCTGYQSQLRAMMKYFGKSQE